MGGYPDLYNHLLRQAQTLSGHDEPLHMKRRLLITACILAVIAIVALMIHAPGKPEPVYQGKRLSGWLPAE